MQDSYRIAHFDLSKIDRAELTPREKVRVSETVKIIPKHWQRIVDVGAGDGRVSFQLQGRGCSVTGIDWSANSLKHFSGDKIVCDIRKPWPFDEPFDGAICCEVLEHLQPEEAMKVVQQLKTYTRFGFVVTVPAREPFNAHLAPCHNCGKLFHIWGHCQVFNNFDTIDQMVGSVSVVRHYIQSDGGVRVSETLASLQRQLGFYPHHPSYICTNCGTPLRAPQKQKKLNWILNKGIALLQRVGSPFRDEGGWYACRYDSSLVKPSGSI